MEIVNRKKRRQTTLIYFFLSGLLTASWSSRIPEIQQELALDNASWGLVLFFMPAGLLAGNLVSSWIISTFGTQKLVVTSCTLTAVFLCFLGVASDTAQMMMALFLFGFSRTLLNIAMNTDSISVQKYYARPIISTFHGVWSIACLIAIGIGTAMIILLVSPIYHFVSVAAFSLAITFLNRRNDQSAAHVIPQKRPVFVLPDRYLALLGIIAFCTLMAEGVMFDWSVNYFEQVIRADRQYVTVGYFSFVITMAAGRLAGDWFIHRFGPLNILLFNGCLMSAGFALSALFPFFFPAAFGFLLIGMGDSIIIPIVYGLPGRSGKMPPAYAIASVSFIGSTGFIFGPLLIGSLSDRVGMQWGFAAMAMVTIFVSILSHLVRKTYITSITTNSESISQNK